MVFESVVADLLNRFLGDYVENLDRSQLKIGIWGGDVVLNDLILKQSALNELDLPVKTVCGRLGKLTLKIPWKNLYTAPVEACIERLFILVVPNSDVKYDASKEEKYKQEAKQKELQRIDKAKLADKGVADKQNDTFVEKLATQIIRNVQISIKDIHLRYEDRVTCPNQPFSLGFTLHLLSVQTTDSQWKPCIVQDSEPKVHKFLDLVGLAVYWNCGSSFFLDSNDTEKMRMFQDGIASRNYLPTGYTYLLGPIDSSAQLTLIPRPELLEPKYSEPKVHLKVDMRELILGIGKYQYQDLVQLLEAFERMETAARYRKYRPAVKCYRGHYKEWWHFAYEAIVKEDIRRKRENWDWNHIHNHRCLCRRYADAYGAMLLSPDGKLKTVIEECEILLDVFNITLVRQKTELEVGRKMLKEEERKASQGWLSSWWGGSKKKTSNINQEGSAGDIVSQFEMAMTAEEREKLHRAIGYGEGSASPEHLPRTFVEFSLSFSLNRLVLDVWDEIDCGSTSKTRTILNARMLGVKFDVQRRPVSALRLIAGISRLEVSGHPSSGSDGIAPVLVAPPTQLHHPSSVDQQQPTDQLLHILFETEPLDGNCDRRLQVRAAPLHVVYDAATIDAVLSVFHPPQGVALERLRAAAISGIEEIKEMSATGLQHTIEQHKHLDLEVNIMSSRILLPQNGSLTKDAALLVINLGGLSMRSVAQKKRMTNISQLVKSGANEEEILKEMFQYSYDQFVIELRDMQVLMACSKEDWEGVVGGNSNLHLLHPLALEVRIFLCLVADDPRLPKVKVDARLPPVHVRFSDERLLSLANLLQSFPFPGQEDKEEHILTMDTCSLASSMYNVNELGTIGARIVPNYQPQVPATPVVLQSTLLEITFQANEISVSVGREVDPVDVSVIEFRLDTLEAQMKQHTFDLSVTLYVGSVSLKHDSLGDKEPIHMLAVVDALKEPVEEELQKKPQEHLLSIHYVQVSNKSPDFQTEWKSVERSLNVHLTGVILAVHAEAVMALKEFGENLLERINQDSTSKKKMNELAPTCPSRTASMLNVNISRGRKKQRGFNPELIHLKVDAHLEQFGISCHVAAHSGPLMRFDVKAMKASAVMHETHTECRASLGSIHTVDLSPKTIHREVIRPLAGETLVLEVVMWNEEHGGNKDLRLRIMLGRVQFIFLNRFINTLLGFINNFQTTKDALVRASANAAEVAKQNVKEAYAQAMRIALDIKVEAPIIVIPTDSQSRDAIVLDLGVLSIANVIRTLAVRNDEGTPATLDEIRINLQNLKLTRVKLLEQEPSSCEEWTLVEPISFILRLQRNLSSGWYTEEPEMEISGHLGSISVTLCEGDMAVIRRVTSGNLNETSLTSGEDDKATLTAMNQVEEAADDVPLRPESLYGLKGLEIESFTQKLEMDIPSTPPLILVSIRLAFVMDNLSINLHRGDHKEEGVESGLAHLEFGLLSLRGCLFSDSSASLSLRLMNCLMEDSRCERGAIVRLLCAGASLQRSSKRLDPARGVLDITVRRKSDDIFADVRVFGFELVLCPQYLAEVSTFFAGGEEVQKEDMQPACTQQPYQSSVSSESKPSSTGSIHLNLRVERPDIVLIADTNNVDTEALLLQGEIELKYRLTANHWTVNGSLQNIRLLACQYNPNVGGKSAVEVLRPCHLNLAGSTPEGMGAHVEVSLSELCLSVFPGTIALLSKVYSSLSAPPDDTDTEGQCNEKDWTDVWKPKKFSEVDYWFLKTEVGEDALLDMSSIKISESCKSELILFSAPSIRVAFEAGVGGRALPLLLLQTCLQGKISDWSSKMRVESSLTLQMEYYNGGLAVWEPIIETVEVIQKDGQSKREPWELCLEVESGGEEYTQITSPNSDDLEEIKLPQPNLTASLSSKDNLEITVTKSCLDVISLLGKAFQNAIDEGTVSSSIPAAPYLVQNDLGISVKLILKGTHFQVPMTDSDEENRGCIREIRLQSGANVSLDKTKSKSTGEDPFNSADEDVLFVEVLTEAPSVEGVGGSWRVDIPVARAECRHFSLRRHQGESWSLVSEINVENGNKVVTLRSAVQVVNELHEPVEVYYMTARGNEVERVGGPLTPGDVLNLPLHAIHTPTAELFFRVEKSTVSTVPFVWKELQRMPAYSSILRCDPKEGGSPVFIQVIGETERIPHERTGKHTLSSVCHRVYLRPTVILRNLLPIDIIVTQSGICGEHPVIAGNDITLPSACPGKCSLVIKIPNYLEREWSCLEDILLNQPELSVWSFESYDATQDATLDLGMHGGKSKGTLELSLFAPCWMVNKTGFLLTYRSAEDSSNILYHPADLNSPVMLAPKGKAFFGKKKALVRIDDSDWSTSFSLDAVGSSGIVSCNTSTFIRQLGVHVQLTGCSLTKRVTFMPRVVLMNTADHDLECREEGRPADPWVCIPSGGCCPLWPVDATDGKLVVRVYGTKEITAPFPLTLINPTLLPLPNKYGGVQVETQNTEGATYITFAPYKPGLSPALIVNHLQKPVEFWEKGSKDIWKLLPNEQRLLAWSNPSGPRILCWKGHKGKEVSNSLTEDALGEVCDNSESEEGYWVSFLDGMQRVLLFTADVVLAQEARTAGELEAASMDLSISLHGLGLSLVDDSKGFEVLHAGIVSSGVLWEVQKSGGKRFRALPAKESLALEKGYQKYLNVLQAEEKTQVQIDSKTLVDFRLMMMERPHRRHLRRSFLTGLWLEMQTSPHGRKIHAKINRLQIDCQLPDSVFPTIFAPVPPPKSVATDSAPKPFVELSIVQRLNEHSTVQQFKYFKILVQEFHVKLDIGFLNALLGLLTADIGLGVYDEIGFKQDLELLKEPLLAYVTIRSSEEQKNFYDLLHFSPLKMHLSFSLTQSGSSGSSGFQSAFLNVLLQSIGVTLTDVQDVVFRLSYFERKGVFLNGRQLIQEVSMHYIGQSLKQLYVLVLGLDVIGNPFGLVLGLTRGVEDLFYEPFQGAVQGPGEFAEGLVLGVRSLFGHTVGGAAGAASRIAGTLGKGIAALSFDPEFQRRRREQMGRQPTNLQEGLARGGRGLVTGVVDGVSGVFLKPISGAMEEGFGGFLKGMGKGVVGLVARPTAGVVDFAGGSLDAVRRAAELSEQVSRLRLPRFLIQGGPVRPFALNEAEGDRLLRELERGRYASTDTYAYHARIPSGVLLLTDKRIIFLHHNDVFGQWQSAWEQTWSEMGDVPHSVEEGIFLMTPKRKVLGLFGGGEHGRVLNIPDARLKMMILGKMEELYKSAK